MRLQDEVVAGELRPSRRVWIMSLAVLGLGSVFGRHTPIRAAEPIAVHEGLARRFIVMAFEMRRQTVAAGDQAYGAVVVKDDRIVSAAPSRVVTNTDPTAHAEMEALRDAALHLGSRDLLISYEFTVHSDHQKPQKSGLSRAMTVRSDYRRLVSGCVLYSSSPPCPMCEAAAYWAQIEHLYYGDPIADGGAPSLRSC